MIDLNVRVLTELSLAFVDSLAPQRGGILNVGSMAGYLPETAARLVKQSRLRAHQSELLANWDRARAKLPLERIAGLDVD